MIGMEFYLNADLFSVGIAIAATFILGFLVYINDRSSMTGRSFFAFAIVTSLWSFFNYISYKFPEPDTILTLQRIVIFLGVWHAFLFFRFVYIFPHREIQLPFLFKYVMPIFVTIVSFFTLTPFVFSGLFALGRNGVVSVPQPGPGIFIFLLVSLGFIIAGILSLAHKIIHAKSTEKTQYALMGAGALIMFALIVMFNILYPAIFLDVRFIPMGALFIFPFVVFTFYAIYKHHLFNLKVATIAFLGFMLTTFSFVNILYSQTESAIAINVTAFIIILLGIIYIIRNTFDLEHVNTQQANLLHFVAHDVKAHLTNSMYAFASIIEEDYGAISDALKTMAQDALSDMRDGMATVIDILNASNLKNGTLTYNKKPFDLKDTLYRMIEQLRRSADKKHLTLDVTISDGSFMLIGDGEKIGQHVIRNIIDNAITYSTSGTIHIELLRDDKVFRLSVKDSGVGITSEDMPRLFTEGGRGKDSTRINIHSTGYGLFVAKMVVEAHGGKIWAESEGAGKGSLFVVEFPVT
jgi:signal transduction histidine kinase